MVAMLLYCLMNKIKGLDFSTNLLLLQICIDGYNGAGTASKRVGMQHMDRAKKAEEAFAARRAAALAKQCM